MRTDSDLVGILIQETNSSGLITLCSSHGAFPTTAGKFAPGCLLTDTAGGGDYYNEGTTSVPSWNNVSEVEADEIEIADGDSFDDDGGLEVLEFGVTASAVNNLKVTNSATTVAPSLSAVGGDTNINIRLAPKGTGVTELYSAEAGAVGAGLDFYQLSASPAGDDALGVIKFNGNNDAAGKVEYANIKGLLGDPAAGAEGGGISINVQDGAGALEEVIGLANDSIWFLKPIAFEQTEQALSGAGAVDTESQTTAWSTGGAVAGTLGNGYAGQLKFIYCAEATGTGTLTPTSLLGFTTIAFTAVGQGVTLYFNGSAWVVVGNNGATLA